MSQTLRQPDFQRNQRLEELLGRLNTLLGPAEQKLTISGESPARPVVFIVGAPRSGTTLALQWLAETGQFAYPTNLLSRFYGAPAVGALIQQLLTDPDFNFRDEILEFNHTLDFKSDLGKTRGALSPNEFWYFWRRFIPNREPRHLTVEEEQAIDGEGLASELAALERTFQKPIALKGIILQYNLPVLAALMPRSIILHIRRHPFFTVQSLLQARLKYFGDRTVWYSVKPPEYASLVKLDPETQVCGQVYFTHRAIQEGMKKIGTSRCLEIGYEDFCDAPSEIYHLLRQKLAGLGEELAPQYSGPGDFQTTNQVRLPTDECELILKAWHKVAGEELAI